MNKRTVVAYYAEKIGGHVKVELKVKGQHHYRVFYFTYEEWRAFREMVQ